MRGDLQAQQSDTKEEPDEEEEQDAKSDVGGDWWTELEAQVQHDRHFVMEKLKNSKEMADIAKWKVAEAGWKGDNSQSGGHDMNEGAKKNDSKMGTAEMMDEEEDDRKKLRPISRQRGGRR